MEARFWDARYAAAELVWGAEPNRWIVEEAAALAPGRALDIGAGEGRNAIWLAGRGWRVTAIDFSAVALDRGRRLAETQSPEVAERITWQRADATQWTAEGQVFDLVLLVYLHLPASERRTVVRQAAAAVAPNGTLLVVGHDTTNLTEGVGGPQDPAVLFTPADIRDDLTDTGLLAVRGERVRRPVRVEGTERPADAVDALVRATRPAEPPSE